jgi:hypothetical protein
VPVLLRTDPGAVSPPPGISHDQVYCAENENRR